MVASTEFLPFGTAVGANVASQASYAGGAWRTAGFQTGIAESQEVNKSIRQAAFMSASWGTWLANTLNTAINDDGDLAASVANIGSALAAYANASVYGVFGAAGGTANALTATISPARAAYTDGELFAIRIATTNTAAATLNINGRGAVSILRSDGTALQASDLVATSTALLIYNSALAAFTIASALPRLAASGYRNCQMLTASGNFAVPAGVTNLHVECVGGGAAGGGSTGVAGAGGGGGGGGFAAGMVTTTPLASLPFVVGAGGAGSTGAGGNGGTTSFASGAIAATGGVGGSGGGTSGAGNGGSPGGLSAGTLGLSGAQGDAGSTNGAYAIAGRGGDAARGGGGGGSPAGPAPGFGGGGGGAINAAGGAGAAGVIFVYW